MGEFCKFEIDFNQFDDLRAVVVHDECGAHEDVWFYRLDGLKAENTKLRECLQDFVDAIKNDDGFGVDLGWMLDRMSELGIEVNK